ncbi:hypothetical protein LR48_Vigan553s001800 [Vigna angularis]|uniref:Uncharacterized protein n=1 Tax=Phaseolus angularis TaxID=3914 RepID=A0A0L9TEK1_PHAAN|nr:hypothetical protein LR48_Vigan553s001800 [Vigna angularis]
MVSELATAFTDIPLCNATLCRRRLHRSPPPAAAAVLAGNLRIWTVSSSDGQPRRFRGPLLRHAPPRAPDLSDRRRPPAAVTTLLHAAPRAACLQPVSGACLSRTALPASESHRASSGRVAGAFSLRSDSPEQPFLPSSLSSQHLDFLSQFLPALMVSASTND